MIAMKQCERLLIVHVQLLQFLDSYVGIGQRCPEASIAAQCVVGKNRHKRCAIWSCRNLFYPLYTAGVAPMPPIIFEPTARRIRVEVNKVMIADSARAMIEIETPIPVYYLPLSDVRRDLLVPSDHTRLDQRRG